MLRTDSPQSHQINKTCSRKITCKEIILQRSMSKFFLPARLTTTFGNRSSATSAFSNTISWHNLKATCKSIYLNLTTIKQTLNPHSHIYIRTRERAYNGSQCLEESFDRRKRLPQNHIITITNKSINKWTNPCFKIFPTGGPYR